MSAFVRAFGLHAVALAAAISCAQAATTVPVPRASITPADLAIIVAQGDPNSEAIAAYYQSVRGIPAANVIRVAVPATDTLTEAQFNAIKAQVDAALPANVQATLLTWTRPFRVRGTCHMSITSAFALGYAAKYCNSVSTAAVPYFDSESKRPWQDFGIRPSMMLGAATYADATRLIDRGLAAEATFPAGDGYLIRTTDRDRSGPRWVDFSLLPAMWNFTGGLRLNYIDNSRGTVGDYITGKSPVLFYFTGLTSVPNIATNTYVPGAVGDHLTSFGGWLSGTGQMESTEWLQAGLTGSYGTVEEPYAVQDKFPKASVMIDHYYRGATLIEAYWKSVRTPGQGLFLGDPLARPFTDLPISTQAGGQYQVQTRSLRAGYRHVIQAREPGSTNWLTLGSTWLNRPGLVTLSAPATASANADLRLESCTDAARGLSITTPNGGEVAQRGRDQRLYFQLEVRNTAAAGSGCEQQIDLATQALPSGLTASVTPASLTVAAGQTATAIVRVDAPAAAAAADDLCFDSTLTMTDRLAGRSNSLTADLIKGCLATPDGDESMLRISRPSWYWNLGDYPERTSFYRYPVDVDAAPDGDIRRVMYTLTAVDMDDGSDPAAYGTVASNMAPASEDGTAASELQIERAAPGYYRLEATAFDSNSQISFTSSVYLHLGMQVNTIRGTAASETLIGTSGNDIIVGDQGADVITGGTGGDVFVYNTMRDALDQVTDFVPGTDRLDLSAIVASLGRTGAQAWAQRYFTLVDTAAGVELRLDSDGQSGPGAARPLVRLLGRTAAEIDPVRDLQLR